MDNIILVLTNISSLGYIIESCRRFINYKKFENNNFLNDFHLIEGKITSENNLSSLVHEYRQNPQNNIIIKKIIVEIGKQKIGTDYYPVKIGDNTVLMPQTYNYIHWKKTHDKITFADNIIMSGRLKLILTNFTPYFLNQDYIKEENHKNKNNLYNMLDKNLVEFKYGDKIKVYEHTILNNENVNVFGNYMANKDFNVKYIGNRAEILKAVRNNVCGLKYGRLLIAGTLFLTSFVGLYENMEIKKSINKILNK